MNASLKTPFHELFPLRGRTLALLFLLALAVRLAALFSLRDAPFTELLLGDAEGFVRWGREIAAGHWFGDEVFYQAPLYPYFLGGVFSLGGGVLTVKLLQALLGALSCVGIGCATSLLFDRLPADASGLGRIGRAGVLAGVLATFYGPSIWLEGLIQKTALATFLGVLVLWCTVRLLVAERDAEPGSKPPAPPLPTTVSLGLFLGLLALVRENSLVLVLPLLAWLLLAAHRRRRAPALLLGLALCLIPVGLRNASLGGTFLPTASNAGVNFYIGNGADADGQYRPLVPGRGHARYEANDAERLAEEAAGRELTPAEVSAHWFGRALGEIRSGGSRWPRLLLWKTVLLLNRTELMDTESFEVAQSASLPLALTGFLDHFGLLFPLALAGLWFARRERNGTGLLLAMALCLAASIVLFFVTERFRISLLPWLLPFAARGALGLYRGVRDAWTRRRSKPAILLAATGAVLANLPLTAPPLDLLGFSPGGDPTAATWSNVASALLARGDAAGAYRAAATAIERAPFDADALYNLGLAARETGRADEAAAAFSEAARIEPRFAPECELELGILLATAGNIAGALPHFEHSVELDPRSARAHYNLALALRQSGRAADAETAYRTSIELDPSFPDAHHNLGLLLEARGETDAAIREYEAALAADPSFERSRFRLSALGAR